MNIRKILVLAFCVALVAPWVAFGSDVTLRGEVLELGCYEREASGPEHAACAVRCLQNGAEMGLLVDGEVVYVDRAGSNKQAIEKLVELGGQVVEVSGTTSVSDEKTTLKVTAAKKAR